MSDNENIESGDVEDQFDKKDDYTNEFVASPESIGMPPSLDVPEVEPAQLWTPPQKEQN